jgi:uncharacterized protein (DUF1800 family)
MAHLLRRAAFGARPDEIRDVYLKQGFEATVDQLVYYEQVAESPNVRAAPADANGPIDVTTMDISPVTDWWLDRMMETRRPLQEKMTLFWHDHFATANDDKIDNAKYLYWQNQFLRQHATANFRDLLKGINKDPAMLIWLDSYINNKRSPNENYARELMEIFSIGFENFLLGAYTESDVQQAARAFTGWYLKPDPGYRTGQNTGPRNSSITDQALVLNLPPKTPDNSRPSQDHDYGTKTVFGVAQNLDGDDIVDLILDREPQRGFAAKMIGKKLFEYFAYENPEPHVVDHLAAVAKRTNFDLKLMLRDLFLNTKEFYSDKAINSLAKWPVHFVISAVRLLQARPDGATLITPLRNMGQWLFYPPDVFGWPGGPEWFGALQMLARMNWANTFASNRSPATGIPFDRVVQSAGLGANANAEQVTDYFISLLVQTPLAPSIRQGLVDYLKRKDDGSAGDFSLGADQATNNEYKKTRGLIRLLLSRPEFQVW